MSSLFPGKDIEILNGRSLSDDNTAKTSTVTISANGYFIIWQLTVSCDVDGETDIENLNGLVLIDILSAGVAIWEAQIHPFNTHVDAQTVVVEHRTVDLGPWIFDFGVRGKYSGVRGEDLGVRVGAFGTDIKSLAHYTVSGGTPP